MSFQDGALALGIQRAFTHRQCALIPPGRFVLLCVFCHRSTAQTVLYSGKWIPNSSRCEAMHTQPELSFILCLELDCFHRPECDSFPRQVFYRLPMGFLEREKQLVWGQYSALALFGQCVVAHCRCASSPPSQSFKYLRRWTIWKASHHKRCDDWVLDDGGVGGVPQIDFE